MPKFVKLTDGTAYGYRTQEDLLSPGDSQLDGHELLIADLAYQIEGVNAAIRHFYNEKMGLETMQVVSDGFDDTHKLAVDRALRIK